MKNLIRIAVFFVISCTAFSQSYYYIQQTGTDPLEDANTVLNSGTEIIARTSTDALSKAQTLPFTWSFFGQSVTKYKASDNGYITFDVTATTSNPTSEVLPSTTAPLNAIFAFWSDLQLKQYGSYSYATDVRCCTYGTAPNRTYAILWYLASPKGVAASTQSFIFEILLYEKGGFAVVHNYQIGSGSYTGIIGAQNANGTLGIMTSDGIDQAFVGNTSTIDYSTDVLFRFYQGTQKTTNFENISVFPTRNVASITEGTNFKGTLRNLGTAKVTSMTLNYSIDDGTPVTVDKKSLNIAIGGSYKFTTAKYTPTEAGKFHNVKVWASNINGVNDEDKSNDTASFSIFTNNGVTASRKVLVEEGTGAWCGYCPDGALDLTTILDDNPDDVIGVTLHNSDSLDLFKSLDSVNSAFAPGYPWGMVDRSVVDGYASVSGDRGDWASMVSTQLSEVTTPVELKVTGTYNPTTRKMSFTTTAKYLDCDFGGKDIRLNAFIIEDKVRGEDHGNTTQYWTQHNYYSSESYSAGGTTHPLYNEPEYMIGYYFNHAVRAVLTPAWGLTGIIPDTILAPQSFSKDFSYTIPQEVYVSYTSQGDSNLYRCTNDGIGRNKPEDTKILVFVTYYNDATSERQVSNSYQINLSDLTVDTETHGAQITVNTTTYDFGPVYVDSSKTIYVPFKNSGDSTLNISSIAVPSTYKSFFTVNKTTAVVLPGASDSIAVTFTPTSSKTYTNVYLTIKSDAVNVPTQQVYLNAIGVANTSVDEKGVASNGNIAISASPNPANLNTNIKYTVSGTEPLYTEITIVNQLGMNVANLLNTTVNPGTNYINYNTANLASGVYYIIMKSQNGTTQLPLVITK